MDEQHGSDAYGGSPVLPKNQRYGFDRYGLRSEDDNDKQETLAQVTDLIDQVLVGDSRQLADLLPDESIDLIFTDPPYPKAFLPLYGWLAEVAARVLKPGGFLLTYTGNMYKDQVIAQLGEHLTYFWDYIALHAGMGTMVWPKNTVARHKSILAYVKGAGKPRCRTLGAFTGSGSDKRFHRWGQDEQTARYYIDCFSRPGDLVWEPFVGGGTTLLVCIQLSRHFIGFEIDECMAELARERLSVVQMPLANFGIDQLRWDQEDEQAGEAG
jgi:DNA methylase